MEPTEWKAIKIMVVDDEPTARMVVGRCLKMCGYTQVTVLDGARKALEELDKTKYQLLLSDLNMPDLDGIALVKQVRTMSGYEDIPIVMMSGTEELDSVYQCLQAGADDYLLKPIQVNAVKNLWKNVWRKRQEREMLTQLSDERQTRTKLDLEMKGLREEIESLKSQFSEAVETPINVITRSVSEISKNENLSDDVRKALSTIVKTLGSSNLYKPIFSKLIEQSSSQLDNTTKRWLAQELKYDDQKSQEDDLITHWPSVKSPEGGVDRLRDWDFDVWKHSSDELLPLVEDAFNAFELFEKFKIDVSKFRRFMLKIRDSYSKKNPYHNFRHAFDVMQAAYIFLTTAGAAQFLTHLEILSLLLACLGHDLEHPGTGNNFHVSTCSHLAIRYNDRSVLENFHCAQLFELIKTPGVDILSNLTETEFKELRKSVINCILATDLAGHVEAVTKFTAVVDTFTRENKEHREMFLMILMKASDISNPSRPSAIARYWSELIQEEFFQQGDIEKSHGLKVSPFMDRDVPQLPKMSLGFIDFFVKPLFTNVQKVLPVTEECLLRIQDTRAFWAKLVEAPAADANSTTTTAAATEAKPEEKKA